jgi:hypothetical protein
MLLRRAKPFVSQNELVRMYNSLVVPYFTYCWLLVKPGTPEQRNTGTRNTEQHNSGTRNTETLKILNLLKIGKKKYRG